MSVLDEREALEVLGLPLNSNFDTVKSCYKKLALKNHPDKDSSSGANERFAKINKAFELLSRIHSSHQPIKSKFIFIIINEFNKLTLLFKEMVLENVNHRRIYLI